jgi:hypothetical protein
MVDLIHQGLIENMKNLEIVPEEQIFIEIIGTNFNIYAIN